MARYTKTIVVNVPPAEAYKAWLNAMDTMTNLAPERFLSFRILQPGEHERTTECVERWAGREMRYRAQETLNAPRRAEQVVTSGHGKGSRTTWDFRPADGGTQVAMDLRLAGFEGFMLGVLMRKRFRKEMDETLRLWSQAIEQASSSRKGK